MRLVMKSGDLIANLKIDQIERVGDVIFAYRNSKIRPAELTPSEFVGMFDLGSVEFLYISDGGDKSGTV